MSRSASPSQRSRSAVQIDIDQRWCQISSHPAINEAAQRSSPGPSIVDTHLGNWQPETDIGHALSPTARRQHTGFPPDLDEELHIVYAEADVERANFCRALEEYERAARNGLKTTVLTDSTHTWADVLRAANNVRDDHFEARGFRGRLTRQLGELIGNNVTTMSAWAEMLPSQSQYFSVICGGLKLIFGAAIRLRKISEDICSALEEIPEVLARTNNTVIMYQRHGLREDSRLHERSASLMASILALLHRIVNELQRSALKRHVACLLKQNKYGQSLNDSLSVMASNVKKFQEVTEDCSERRIWTPEAG